MVPIKSATKIGEWVVNVPTPSATDRFPASAPASASAGIATVKRPNAMLMPVETL